MIRILFFSVMFLCLGLTSSFLPKGTSRATVKEGQKIEIIFNRTLTFGSLASIKQMLLDKKIRLDYRSLEFDERGYLTSISFQVRFPDGFSGSAENNHLTQKSKFGFIREYSTLPEKVPLVTGDLE